MEIKASQQFIRISPRKTRTVAEAVKVLTPAQALLKLKFMNHHAAELLAKVIKQALANANGKKTETSTLKFKSIEINQGPTLKRWRAAARGRGSRINKRTSHIKVVLESVTTAKEPKNGTKS